MPCFHPLRAFRSFSKKENGKARIFFQEPQEAAEGIELPCGQCVGCRLERSRQWAIRCMHEASLHEENSYLTLTYSEAELPPLGNLRFRDFQLFLKRFRKWCPTPVRYFHCGEYGDISGRPHYHCLLFGYDFPDKVFLKMSGEFALYASKNLDDLWSHGHCFIGDVSFESAAYVARYNMKKVTGEAAAEHYERVDPETGEVVMLQPEYVTMSRGSGKTHPDPRFRGGIGSGWFKKYGHQLTVENDFIIVKGRKVFPPKFYDEQIEKVDPERLSLMKEARVERAELFKENNTPERRAVREEVVKKRLARLPRERSDQ